MDKDLFGFGDQCRVTSTNTGPKQENLAERRKYITHMWTWVGGALFFIVILNNLI